MITAAQLRTQYAKNAEGLRQMVEKAKVATNEGKGGAKGKRYNGYSYHQLVGMYEARVADSTRTDAELAPMLNLLNRALIVEAR